MVGAAGLPPPGDVALRRDTSWLSVDRARLQFQGEQDKAVSLRFDASRLRQPGVYVGRVLGTPLGQGAPAFQLMAVVVVPERFVGGAERTWRDLRLGPGDVGRFFLQVPPGATAMEIRVEVPEGRDGRVWTELYAPIGAPAGRRQGSADSERGGELVIRVDHDELIPGTWEMDLIGAHDAVTDSVCELGVRFFGLSATPGVVGEIEGGASEPASASVTVVNVYDEPFSGEVRGWIDRLQSTSEQEAPADGWTKTFELTTDRPRASFRMQFALEDYSQMTDVALRILDADGNAVSRSWVGARGGEIEISGSGTYTVEMRAAHHDKDADSTPFELEERYYLGSPARVVASLEGDDHVDLYPGLAADLALEIEGVLPHTADDFVAAGEVMFRSEYDESEWLVLPIRVP